MEPTPTLHCCITAPRARGHAHNRTSHPFDSGVTPPPSRMLQLSFFYALQLVLAEDAGSDVRIKTWPEREEVLGFSGTVETDAL